MVVKVCLAHLKKYCPGGGYILSLEFQVFHDFLIAEEAIGSDKFILVVAIVDCSHFPAPMRQGPFVMLSHIDVIFFHELSRIDQVECLFLTSSLLNYLALKVALNLEAVIEHQRFFIVQVQLREKCTPKHIIDSISILHVHLLLDSLIDQSPKPCIQC